jgi:hypothetical protein
MAFFNNSTKLYHSKHLIIKFLGLQMVLRGCISYNCHVTFKRLGFYLKKLFLISNIGDVKHLQGINLCLSNMYKYCIFSILDRLNKIMIGAAVKLHIMRNICCYGTTGISICIVLVDLCNSKKCLCKK